MRLPLPYALLVLGTAVSGCYLAHDGDPRAGTDSGIASADGGRRDGAPFDASNDASSRDLGISRDAGSAADMFDAGIDRGFLSDAGEDAPPPLEAPPDPGVCRTEPEIFPFMDPVLEYRWPTAPPTQYSDAVHVCATPLVVDVNPDGLTIQPEVAFVSYNTHGREGVIEGVLRIVDPRTDTTITYPNDSITTGPFEATTNVAAADLDGDGRAEIVGIGVAWGTIAVHGDGTFMWESPYPSATDRGAIGVGGRASVAGAVSIADLEGDGIPEVIVGHTVLDGRSGELHWNGALETGRGVDQHAIGPISCVADLDNDGVQEVIAGRTAFRANGDVYWDHAEYPDGFCAVAEIDATVDGPEIVLVGNGYIRLLNGRTGDVLWLLQLAGRVAISAGGAPTVADFDGDGRLEFGIAHGAAYGVYDRDCRGANDPFPCEAEGVLWHQPTNDDSSSSTGSSVFDFNGDGRAEVIYNDQEYFRVYDGIGGTPLFQWRNSSRTRTENPVVADVDNDGDAEIVFSANSEAFFLRTYYTDPGVEIWGDARGRWVDARRIWNQHTYHVTNINEDGTLPLHERASWDVLNAYRENIREGSTDVLVSPDLWGGRGSYSCLGGGRARLEVLVQNRGLDRLGDNVAVAFYRGDPAHGGERIGEVRTTSRLEVGSPGETVTFDTSLGLPVIDYYAVLDDPDDVPGGQVAECREDNNRVLFWRPSCP
ncbi:MAG: VCBS repeat-containing protein [Sandaracinaceae bacterium]|nr:VCBS repeat-containing protein [Sandaracinaceae bacterium]